MDWFAEWFNTPYYHILYKNRDDREAQEFISYLLKYLSISTNEKILDLACGKGRYSIFLNKLGYDIIGVDLASESIKEAKTFENERLKFFEGDMRNPNFPSTFSVVFNLFTSFGYFSDEEDNFRVYKSVYEQIKENGIFVMDFMNASLVENDLIPIEDKVVDGITFHLERKVENDFVIKNITFTDQGKDYYYQERVKAFKLDYFKKLGEKVGFTLTDIFGDYQLNEFNESKSPRLILIFKK